MFSFDFSKIPDLLVYDEQAPILFSSGLFLFLFLGFFGIYLLARKHKALRLWWVTLFSLYFYYKCAGHYWVLHVILVVVDFHLARWMEQTADKNRRRWLLWVSLALNLGMLAYFKYTNYFLELWTGLNNGTFTPLDIFLPAGISFFTFQSLSYTIDVYRGQLKALDDMLDYAFFVTFFPQMLAGPIVRAADFLPQIDRVPYVSREDFGRAVFLFCCGLFKKAVISDYISINFVDRVFDQPLLYSGVENLMGLYGYAMQIYCDFSGYTDMAIALALLMGFHFPINFDAPYKSLSVTEFWRRWHISLSTWLRDYLYIPLGGNRGDSAGTWIVTGGFFALTLGMAAYKATLGNWWWLGGWTVVAAVIALPAMLRRDTQALATSFNLFATMLLGGLWHGAASRFLVWGGLHGMALAIEKWVSVRFPGRPGAFRRILAGIWTFHFVCFCWIFFRAEGMEKVGEMLGQIAFSFHPEFFPDFVAGYGAVLFWILLGFALHFLPKSTETAALHIATRLPLLGKAILLTAIAALVMQIKSADVQAFIYFQF
ncbi:MAG: MBOAT family O-acyltransferase [Saprospiraceae bacterium]|nr:MBOAT family O-acyltransferase [Saprospiraceae bacterium]